MGSEIAVGLIMACMAITAIVLGVEKLLKLYIARSIRKIEKKFDKIMDDMEEWSKEEG
jgi:hypothetical protein